MKEVNRNAGIRGGKRKEQYRYAGKRRGKKKIKKERGRRQEEAASRGPLAVDREVLVYTAGGLSRKLVVVQINSNTLSPPRQH